MKSFAQRLSAKTTVAAFTLLPSGGLVAQPNDFERDRELRELAQGRQGCKTEAPLKLDAQNNTFTIACGFTTLAPLELLVERMEKLAQASEGKWPDKLVMWMEEKPGQWHHAELSPTKLRDLVNELKQEKIKPERVYIMPEAKNMITIDSDDDIYISTGLLASVPLQSIVDNIHKAIETTRKRQGQSIA